MTLDLLALGWLAAAVIAGAVVIVRGLLLVPAAGTPLCARCGLPASELTTFTCPRCRRDVREAGVFVPRSRSPAAALWLLMAWSIVVMLAAIGADAMVTWL